MICFKSFKKSKGQALVEAALAAPLIVFFLFTIIWFARVMLTWQQLESAARYGTDMIAYTPFSENRIKSDIQNYLCNRSNIGRTLDADNLGIEIVLNDYPRIGILLSFEDSAGGISGMLDSIKSYAEGILPFAKKSYVEVSYSYRTPPLLRLVSENITIKARSEVLSGTGSAGSKIRESN
jgi:Flp pilus assembly protein TadG